MLSSRPDVTLGLARESSDGVLISPVLASGAETGLSVHGIDLGPVFAARHGTLLFVEYGDDWEQSLTITLASPDWRVLDSATLAAAGVSGNLRDVAVTGPDSLRFVFFGDRRWNLFLAVKPAIAVPFFSAPFGVQRPFQWRRWFSVHPA